MTRLDRYLLAEMTWPFLGGVLTFAVLITGHMLFLAIETMVDHHVPLSGVVKYITYQLPGALIMALPVATLLACSLAYNRLARDSELIALRSGGMSTWRLVLPGLALGLLAGLASVWLSGSLAPRSKQAASDLMREVVLSQRALAFKPHQFLDTGRGLSLYVEGADEAKDEVSGLHVFCFRPQGPPMLLWAPKAQFGATTLAVPQPRFYLLETSGALTYGESDSIDIDLTQVGSAASGRQRGLNDESLQALWRQAYGPMQSRSAALELHSRLAMGFTCLVFALLAAPVTLRFSRGQSLVGVLATIIVVFVFYVVMLWMRMLGESATLPVVASAWGETAAVAVIALLGIWRVR